MKNFWKPIDLEFVKRNVRLTDRDLGKLLNRTEESVRKARQYHRINKGGPVKFVKGYKSWNTGLSYCVIKRRTHPMKGKFDLEQYYKQNII